MPPVNYRAGCSHDTLRIAKRWLEFGNGYGEWVPSFVCVHCGTDDSMAVELNPDQLAMRYRVVIGPAPTTTREFPPKGNT